MKLTKETLKRIIKEELETTLSEMASFKQVPSEIYPFSQIKKNSNMIPQTPGVYFIYFNTEKFEELIFQHDVDKKDFLSCHRATLDGNNYTLVYVGMAGESNNLRKRIKSQHFGGNVAASIFKAKIGWLLDTYDSSMIKKFEEEYMAITFTSTKTEKDAAKLEDSFLKSCPFPFNVKANTVTSKKTIKVVSKGQSGIKKRFKDRPRKRK
jgi:excinuclease UvrABC nuclease subunit